MRQATTPCHFAQQVLQCRRIPSDFGWEKLECHPLLQLFVEGEPDFTHPALTQRPRQQETSAAHPLS
jgi:hypothetical protein